MITGVYSLGNVNAYRADGGDGGISVQLAEGTRAVAIGPRSLVDTVLVDGVALSVGMVLAVNSSVRVLPFRCYRHGIDAVAGDDANNLVELVGYTRGDEALATPQRAPIIVAAQGTLDANTPTRLLRVPFMGRRMAQLRMMADAPPVETFNTIAVYGYRFRSRATAPAIGDVPYIGEIQASRNLVGGIGPSTEDLSTVLYLGGVDHAESYDELEVWGTAVSALTGYRVEVEAWGENGGTW